MGQDGVGVNFYAFWVVNIKALHAISMQISFGCCTITCWMSTSISGYILTQVAVGPLYKIYNSANLHCNDVTKYMVFVRFPFLNHNIELWFKRKWYQFPKNAIFYFDAMNVKKQKNCKIRNMFKSCHPCLIISH